MTMMKATKTSAIVVLLGKFLTTILTMLVMDSNGNIGNVYSVHTNNTRFHDKAFTASVTSLSILCDKRVLISRLERFNVSNGKGRCEKSMPV